MLGSETHASLPLSHPSWIRAPRENAGSCNAYRIAGIGATEHPSNMDCYEYFLTCVWVPIMARIQEDLFQRTLKQTLHLLFIPRTETSLASEPWIQSDRWNEMRRPGSFNAPGLAISSQVATSWYLSLRALSDCTWRRDLGSPGFWGMTISLHRPRASAEQTPGVRAGSGRLSADPGEKNRETEKQE